MFGEKYLVAPIFELNCFEREVYLPAGEWKLTSTGEVYKGGQTVSVKAPIEYMPVFERLSVYTLIIWSFISGVYLLRNTKVYS
jgi:alpha-D-xyloside xylohydrolase